ncbi:MAG: hypothetical protein PVF35_02525, partial [Gammaproteobacteria bacterium]
YIKAGDFRSPNNAFDVTRPGVCATLWMRQVCSAQQGLARPASGIMPVQCMYDMLQHQYF